MNFDASFEIRSSHAIGELMATRVRTEQSLSNHEYIPFPR
jgi:hypothetical protein